MKGKEYTKKDLVLALIVAGCVTIFDFAEVCVLAFQYVVNWSELVKILSFLLYFPLQILTILSWYMCIERYYFCEYSVEERTDKQNRIPIFLSIIVMVILGVIAFENILSIVVFAGEHWAYIEKLDTCIVIRGVIAIGWFGCWLYSIKMRKAIGRKGGIRLKKVIISVIVCGLLIGASGVGNSYIDKRVEDAWFESLWYGE
mgnify:CR=1 FL=1